MEKKAEGNYSAEDPASEFAPLDFSLDHHPSNQLLRPRESPEDNMEMVEFMLNHPAPHHHPTLPQRQLSLDKLSFAEVMQFADFGPKLTLNQSRVSDEENYFLKFPVIGARLQDDDPVMEQQAPVPLLPPLPPMVAPSNHGDQGITGLGTGEGRREVLAVPGAEQEEPRDSENVSSVQQPHFRGVCDEQTKRESAEAKNRRKRPRSMKTSEEVEIQRITHIAVERNRRKHMNEHLRVLRSLMPGSYVQRGDQASIIGGAIEFVRELEQLLQCLESQKRRRMYGGEPVRPPPPPDPQLPIQLTPHHLAVPFFPSPPFPGADQMKLVDYDAASCGGSGTLREEAAESKSCLADVEVKLLGFDAVIKILSRRRPGQLLKTIAALEDLQLNILHTNITTIEETVLYSFNVKWHGVLSARVCILCLNRSQEKRRLVQRTLRIQFSRYSASSTRARCDPFATEQILTDINYDKLIFGGGRNGERRSVDPADCGLPSCSIRIRCGYYYYY